MFATPPRCPSHYVGADLGRLVTVAVVADRVFKTHTFPDPHDAGKNHSASTNPGRLQVFCTDDQCPVSGDLHRCVLCVIICSE